MGRHQIQFARTSRKHVPNHIGRHVVPMTICKARHQRAPFTVDDGHIIGLRNRQRLFRYLFDEVSFNQNI